MKAKFFLAAMVAIAIVGCNKNGAAPEMPSLDGPSAMIQVNLKAAQTTKAYTDGIDAENAVKSVDFYFYDAAGNAYSVVEGNVNMISWKPEGTETDNVAFKSDIVLVIKQAQTAPPAKVVAILNSATKYTGISLSALAEEVVTTLHTSKTNFVMSNSVYYNENLGAVMMASDITTDNLFVDPDYTGAAGDVYKGNVNVVPVDIYVERVAAKVSVNFGTGLVPVKDEKGIQMKDAAGNDVYVNFLGWNVTNATDQAYLVKNLSTSYTFTPAWTAWNNAADYRSYWANTTDTPEHKHTFTALTEHTDAYDYYFENTGAEKSQLLVAAELVDAKGEPVSLAKWYNVIYTIDAAQTLVANTLATKLFTYDATAGKLVSVTASDITFYQKACKDGETVNEKRYEVLVKAKDGVTYYKPELSEEDEPVAYTEKEVTAILNGVEPIMIWNEGMTYYYTTIKHLGGTEGIVRNHEYQITVTGVKGFGTPVYNPEEVIIPEEPSQDALNIAAEINILSWNIVSQDVQLGF